MLSLSTYMTLLIVIDHKRHKARNIRKSTRHRLSEPWSERLSERVFQQIIHDIAKEIKPGIRFQTSAFAPLQEAVESFAVTYFSRKCFIRINMYTLER